MVVYIIMHDYYIYVVKKCSKRLLVTTRCDFAEKKTFDRKKN